MWTSRGIWRRASRSSKLHRDSIGREGPAGHDSFTKYDAVVKDLFQKDHPSLLDQLTGGVKIKAVLNVELAKVLERRADLVLLLEDESILHIEFQSTNDKDMAYRAGIYCVLLGQKYRCRIRQVVLYTGQAKMRMPDSVFLGETRIVYTLMDIRALESEALIASGRPGDLVLAMLAKGGPERLVEILRRTIELNGPERERTLTQLAILSRLRQLTGRLKMELKAMGGTIDIAKHEILRDIVRDSQASIIRIQLRAKFGELPKWVDERLSNAKLSDVARWAKRFVTAKTLEGVLGKQ
jgi:hypothetical protein